MTQDDPTWVQVIKSQEFRLLEPGRLAKLSEHLPDPVAQKPSILLFAGRTAKLAALKSIFPQNSFKGNYRRSAITLTLDNNSLSCRFPVLFAESPSEKSFQAAEDSPLVSNKSYPIRSSDATSLSSAYNLLHARLLSLFVDVFCIFADDIGGLDSALTLLQNWARDGGTQSNFKTKKPRVVIVGGRSGGTSPCIEDFLAGGKSPQYDRKLLKTFYGSILVFTLPTPELSADARYRTLKETIWRQKDEMMLLRKQLACCLSFEPTARFFGLAIGHVSADPAKPFDFLVESRRDFGVRADCSHHLTRFLRLAQQHGLSQDLASRYLASTLIYDAFPPGMHRR